MPGKKIFWVKYIYIKANFDFGPYVDLNKIHPGKWTEDDKPQGAYLNAVNKFNKWAGSHSRVRCASQDEIVDILFDHEHKRLGYKCFIRLLRCVEIEFNGLDHSDILVEVNYKIIITKLNKKGQPKHSPISKFGLSLYWDTFNKGHIGMDDKELIAFKAGTDPAEYNNAEALLKKLPPAPMGTRLEIKKFQIFINKQ